LEDDEDPCHKNTEEEILMVVSASVKDQCDSDDRNSEKPSILQRWYQCNYDVH
jgi:hypothetical protein